MVSAILRTKYGVPQEPPRWRSGSGFGSFALYCGFNRLGTVDESPFFQRRLCGSRWIRHHQPMDWGSDLNCGHVDFLGRLRLGVSKGEAVGEDSMTSEGVKAALLTNTPNVRLFNYGSLRQSSAVKWRSKDPIPFQSSRLAPKHTAMIQRDRGAINVADNDECLRCGSHAVLAVTAARRRGAGETMTARTAMCTTASAARRHRSERCSGGGTCGRLSGAGGCRCHPGPLLPP